MAAAASAVEQHDPLLEAILSHLPPADRIRAIGVSRRWDSLLLQRLGFDGFPERSVGSPALTWLCRRAGRRLLSLDVSAAACSGVDFGEALHAACSDPVAPSPFAITRPMRMQLRRDAPLSGLKFNPSVEEVGHLLVCLSAVYGLFAKNHLPDMPGNE